MVSNTFCLSGLGFMTTGRNSPLVPVWCNWPMWSFRCSRAGRNDAADPSLDNTYKIVHMYWCCSYRYSQMDTFHHMTLCWPVNKTHNTWAILQLNYSQIYIYIITHRSVATTVILSNCHPHCHFLTWFPIFFT